MEFQKFSKWIIFFINFYLLIDFLCFLQIVLY